MHEQFEAIHPFLDGNGRIDQLFVNPYMTAKRAAQVLDVSNPTARKAVLQLEQDGILREVTGRDWGKIYLASAISEAIQFPT